VATSKKTKKPQPQYKRLQYWKNSVWTFPLALTVCLLLLTCLKISGSSIGIYDGILGLPQSHRSMLANQPQVIRSDEWLVVSQLTIAQRYDHYQCVNPNIGNGENVSVIDAGIPCKDWSAVFQPENIAFFIIPFNYAFAFKWWFMAYALILSVYFFMMAVFPAKKRWAALLSVALFFSPFVQWWYQLATLGPIYCTLILLTLFIYMLRENNRKKQLLIAAGMWYTTTCFALILYPPFMIACLYTH
jgi:hypothetical protein